MILNKIKGQIDAFRENKHLKEIASGTVIAFGVKAFAVVIIFLFNIVLSRYLGEAETGRYFLTFSIVSIAAVFAKHGLDKSLLRFIVPEISQGNWKKAYAILLYSTRKVLTYGIVISILIFLSADIIATYWLKRPELNFYVRLFSLAIIPISFSFCLTEAFKAAKKIAFSLSIRGIAIPVISMLGILFFAKENGLLIAIVSQIVGATLVIIYSSYAFYKYITKNSFKLDTKENIFDKQALTDSSRPLFISAVLQELLLWIPTFIIGYYLLDADVGRFEIVKRIGLATNFFLAAFNTIITPKIGELYAKQEMKILGMVCRKSTALIALITGPVFLGLYFFPAEILSIFGKGFTVSTALPLQIILIGQFVHVLFGPTGNILLMCGHEKHLKYSAIIGVVIITILNLLLVPKIGVLGAAIAHSTALIIRNFYVAILVKYHLDIITLPLVSNIFTKYQKT